MMKIKNSLKKFLGIHNSTLTVGKNNETTRNQWIISTLGKLPSGLRILDVGAGEKPYEDYCTHLDYISQDFGKYNPNDVNFGLQVDDWNYGKLDIISDIASIPVADNSFDAILCTEVLEHVINPKEAIKEFSRILKSGGYLIITTPFCSLTHFAPYHFYSGFSRFFYETVLKNDYYDVEVTVNGNYFEYLAQEINRLEYTGKKYSNVELTKNERKRMRTVNLLLERLSKQDSGSDELLCFGYFILARRK